MYKKSSKDVSEQFPAPNRLKMNWGFFCKFDHFCRVNKQLNLLWKHNDTGKKGNLD